MLPRSNRMSRAYFANVFQHAFVRRTPHFLVYIGRDSSSIGHGAVVVSKKIKKSAVGRHRLRRQLYGLLRHFLLERKQPIDVIIIAKRGVETLSYDAMTKELAPLFV